MDAQGCRLEGCLGLQVGWMPRAAGCARVRQRAVGWRLHEPLSQARQAAERRVVGLLDDLG